MTRHEDLTDEQGRALGGVQPDEWLVPGRVVVDSGYLVPDYRNSRRRSSDATLVPAFAQLREADDHAIAAFASSAGMLGLCGHGKGRFHRPASEDDENLATEESFPDPVRRSDLFGHISCRVPPGVRHPSFQLVDGWSNDYGNAEPLDQWRFYAAGFNGLLEVRTRADPAMERGQLARWLLVEQVLTWLMQESGVRPYLLRPWWLREDAEPSLVIGGDSLFAGLVVQALYALTGGGPHVARCTGCNAWFSPKRRPADGALSWCPSCRELGVDSRHYAVTYRARNRHDPGRARLRRGRRAAGA